MRKSIPDIIYDFAHSLKTINATVKSIYVDEKTYLTLCKDYQQRRPGEQIDQLVYRSPLGKIKINKYEE